MYLQIKFSGEDFMRYVIVCLIKGEALNFHETLVEDICNRFKVKRQRLPAHFTIKAPFETENINELENLMENYCKEIQSTPVLLEGYGHFRDAVVYMDVHASNEAVKVHDDFIDRLKTTDWLDWKRNEGKGKVFHCTLVSKLPPGKFPEIWQYVSDFPFSYSTFFDNISILVWEKDRWITYKEYRFKDRT